MTKEQEEAIENLTKLLKQRDEKQVKITTTLQSLQRSLQR